MITRTLFFKSSLPHEELDELLQKLELVFENRFDRATSIDVTKHSNSHFEVVFNFNLPENVDEDDFVELVLAKEDVNMALFEVGLTGFLI